MISSLKLEYAEACQAANELPKAKSLAQQAVDADPKNAAAHLVLGRILSQMNENRRGQATARNRGRDSAGFHQWIRVGVRVLETKGRRRRGQNILPKCWPSFGDKPGIHLEFGSARMPMPDIRRKRFRNSRRPSRRILHCRARITALGAAYMLGLGVPAYEQAAAEFEKELKISPNDYNSHLELGVIYLSQNKLPEAENELTRAASLDPRNPDPFISLGQLYDQTNQLPEAEAAYRKAIALTTDAARNHYQVERAHYLLARVLLQTNRQDEAKKEMEISNQLLKLSVLAQQGRISNRSRKGSRERR